MLHPSPLRSIRDVLRLGAARRVLLACARLPRRLACVLVAPALALATGVHAAHAQRGAPTVAQVERALEQRLQKLRPDGMSERNVLFQSVRAGSPSGSSFPYRVTMVVRDYGAGYPANHFYGETCVARFEDETFTAEPDSFGGWSVSGRFTPDLSHTTCKPNPSAGVSSMPLAGLTGTSVAAPGPAEQSAPRATVPAEAPRGADGGVATGAYECWANGEARLLMNFTVRGGGRYVGSDGKSGTYRFDPATQRITFTGGSLDGVMPAGFSAIYHLSQGRPTVSFRGRGGGEAAYCERR